MAIAMIDFYYFMPWLGIKPRRTVATSTVENLRISAHFCAKVLLDVSGALRKGLHTFLVDITMPR